jgi:hypothetical protein
MQPKINTRLSIISHAGANVVILVGEDGTTLAITPEVAHILAAQLPSMADLAAPSMAPGSQEDAWRPFFRDLKTILN